VAHSSRLTPFVGIDVQLKTLAIAVLFDEAPAPRILNSPVRRSHSITMSD
jgi:hypothetical protein